MDSNVVGVDDSDEVENCKIHNFTKKREGENENIRRMVQSKEGRRYILRQLKRAFPLGGGSLCTQGQGTFYNLGKFESYLEILLDLREAYWQDEADGKKLIAEILLGWFFDSEIDG